MKPASNIIELLINANQNTHRLDDLKPLNQLSNAAQRDILCLLHSKGDRAHHCLGVLLWAMLSKNTYVAVVSTRDMDKLILMAAKKIDDGDFSVRSTRLCQDSAMTVWAQFTGFAVKRNMIEIVKPQIRKAPAVIQLIHPELLNHFDVTITDDRKLEIINSTSKIKFPTYKSFKASIAQGTVASEGNPKQKESELVCLKKKNSTKQRVLTNFKKNGMQNSKPQGL